MTLQQNLYQPTIVTLHDAITDSPVYRANVLHFDEQIELVEKWLDALSKQLKLYTDKLHKFNLETNLVCKKVIPVGVDDTLIDPNFTGAVIKSFSDSLQACLAFKTKLVSDLEDGFIQPLSQFLKTHVKDFKEFRKQHERALERYESQLAKYTSQSKTKEASAVREEAFRLHEARKIYTRLSGQHVVRMLYFRSLLEHFLVNHFSSASVAHLEDIDGAKQIWQKLNVSLSSWKQWLAEDRYTCDQQLHKLQASRTRLEAEYIEKTRPIRDLDHYASAVNGSQVSVAALNSRHSIDFSTIQNESQSSVKWGYLSMRVARATWTRKWFFLHDGYFGSCHVNNSGKYKGTISVGERVSVLLCDIKPAADSDRRACFEVLCAQQAPFFLQAETEAEMRDWITAFAKAKQQLLENKPVDRHASNSGQPEQNIPIGDADSPKPTRASLPTKTSSATPLDQSNSSNISNGSALSVSTFNSSSENEHPSVVVLSNPTNSTVTLATSTSLTPFLVCEATKAKMPNGSNSAGSSPTNLSSPAAIPTPSTASQSASNTTASTTANPAATSAASNAATPANASSWGIPWTLVPNMFTGAVAAEENSNPLMAISSFGVQAAAGGVDAEGHPIIWPAKADDSNRVKVELSEYTLEAENRGLRRLFSGVSPTEVVLDAVSATLKKKEVVQQTEDEDIDPIPMSPSTPTAAVALSEALDQELRIHLGQPSSEPVSEFGTAYTGRIFLTQDTLWFYSCTLMTCVNTVAVSLKDIKAIRLVREKATVDGQIKAKLVIAIDLNPSSQSEEKGPLMLSPLLDDIEVFAEKLRIASDSAKSSQPLPIQTLYDVLRNISAAMGNNTSNNQTKHVIRSDPSPKKTETPPPAEITSDPTSIHEVEPVMSPTPDGSKKKRKARKSSGSSKPAPKTGALAAAMMAATVAGGSGFFDASKIARIEDAQKNSKRTSGKRETTESTETNNIKPENISLDTTSDTKEQTGDTPQPANDEIPSHIELPQGPCNCECGDHLEKVESEVILPISAKKLYDLMFAEDTSKPIWEAKNRASSGSNFRIGSWEQVDGRSQRVLKYILPVNNPMVKIKEAEVVETQWILKKEDYIRYVVQISTKTAQLPYADSFIPSVKYCISWVSEKQCKLVCSMGVQFVKSIFVKSMVSKAALKGMGESIQLFVPLLEQEAERIASPDAVTKTPEDILNRTTTLRRQQHVSRVKPSDSAIIEKNPDTVLDRLLKLQSTVSEYLSFVPVYIRTGLAVILFLWTVWPWLRSDSAGPIVPTEAMDHNPLGKSHVAARAVYLRDLEEGLLNNKFPPAYIDSESFQWFLETKLNDATQQDAPQSWLSSRHHSMAVSLDFSRERVAMLRHDLLVIFQLLNQVDSQLLESEYINWLSDTRLRCRQANGHSQPTPPARVCEQVSGQLSLFYQ